jgi:hypothetical protein
LSKANQFKLETDKLLLTRATLFLRPPVAGDLLEIALYPDHLVAVRRDENGD